MSQLATNRRTYKASAMSGHKVYNFGSNIAGRGNKIAFVFAVFIINHNNQFAGFYIGNSSLNRIKFNFHPAKVQKPYFMVELKWYLIFELKSIKKPLF